MDLTPANLLAALELAGSQHDANTREQGENRLDQWRDQAALYILLQDVYLDHNLPLTARWLAVIYMKNKIKDVWRSSAISKKSAILTDQDKQTIRQKFFTGINESNRKLQVQNSDLIARVARMDFPHHWPGLFDNLTSLIHGAYASGDTITLYNGLSVMKHVLKELASVRVGRTKVQLQSYAPQLLQMISEIYMDYTNRWTSSTPPDLGHIEVGYLAMKVSCRLLYDGIVQPNRQDEANQFFKTIVNHLQIFLNVLNSTDAPPLVFKHVICIAKSMKKLVEKQGDAMILMPDAEVLVRIYLEEIKLRASLFTGVQESVDEDLVESYSKFIRLVLEFIKLILEIPMGKARHYSKTEEDREEHRIAREKVNMLFNKEHLQNLVNILMVDYFRVNEQDMDSWQSDAEDFFVEQELQVSAWDVLLRPCAAAVFTDVLSFFGDQVSDYVLHVIQTAVTDVSVSKDAITRRQALTLDCVFQALQYGYAILFEKVDFNVILPGILQLGNRQYVDMPSQAIVFRRILLLISTWVSAENLTTQSHGDIYQFVLNQFGHPDLVVALTAANTLRYSIDIYDFSSHKQAFLPYTEGAVSGLFKLLEIVHNMDCKVVLLQGISVIVEQLGDAVIPFISNILLLLPTLWKDAEEQSENRVMQGVVLQTLTHVVQALAWGSRSSSDAITDCCKLGLPVLQTIIDPTSKVHTYLYEDSLQLWHAYLEYSERNADTELLLPLGTQLLALMQHSSENLAFEATILELYMNFACDYFAEPDTTARMFQLFAHFVPAISEDIMAIISRTLEVYVTLRPLDSYVECLYSSGLFAALVQYVSSNDSSVANKNRVYSIFARLAVSNPPVFVQLLDHSANTSQSAKHEFAVKWVQQFQNMGHPRDRKLAGLGFAALLQTGDVVWTTQLSQLLDIWCELLDEVNEDSGDSEVYYRTPGTDNDDSELSTAHQRRMMRIRREMDPVHGVSLRSAIKHALGPLRPHIQDAGLSESAAIVFGELS